MITKNELKYYSSLLIKKFRKSEKKFIVEGEKSVTEGLKSRYRCEIVFMTHESAAVNPDLAESAGSRCRLEVIKSTEFNKLTDTVNPQGICAVFSKPDNKNTDLLRLSGKLTIYLDNISDPGNAGTILRTCDWFGVKDIFVSPNTAEIYNPKTLRSSMGSVFHLNIYEDAAAENIFPVLKSAGYTICSSDLAGKSIYEYTFKDKTMIVFSSEAAGPSDYITSASNDRITIPGTGKAESLNVAVAAGIILAAVNR